MSAFSSSTFLPPKDWQDFERKSRILFECVFKDPQTQTHGRGGQAQDGVDIFGRRDGGTGRLVGVQCKGKDSRYGKQVTAAELRTEVKKSERFAPSLDEFILITTAPDDKNIQASARTLEAEVRKAGRNLSIAVWGWNTLEQRISEHHRAIKAFHPDYTLVSDELLESSKKLIDASLSAEASHRGHDEKLDQIKTLLQQKTAVASEPPQFRSDPIFDGEIDQYRSLNTGGKSQTAATLLEAMRTRVWGNASGRVKFRILTNLGFAYHELGESAKMAQAFLEAATYEPSNHVAAANKVAGLLVVGNRDVAIQEVERAAKLFPDSDAVALQRLQAHPAEEALKTVWNNLPESLRLRPEIAAMRLSLLRKVADDRWTEEARHLAEANPLDGQLKRLSAEATLEQALRADPALLGAGTVDTNRLKDAARTLEEQWLESLEGERPADGGAAHNAAVAYLIVRDVEGATRVADAALARNVAVEETKRLRIGLYVRQGNDKAAIAIVESMAPNIRRDLSLAELVVSSDPRRARELVAGIKKAITDDVDRIGTGIIIVESYITERDWIAASEEAERLSAAFENHPIGPLLLHRIQLEQGSEAARASLEVAFKRLNPAVPFPFRYMVAQALQQAELYDEVVKALEGHVDESRNSPALRTFLVAALNADRRATVARVLQRLTDVQDRFIQRIRAALDIRSGDVRAAEEAIRAYLDIAPRDLAMHLQLLSLLQRQDDVERLREELSKPFSNFDGDPGSWMQLAHVLDVNGRWSEAYRLAYLTWLNNQRSPEVCLGYIGLFLKPGHTSEEAVAFDAVVLDAAFGMRSESQVRKFVIEPDPALRTETYTISPDHAISVAAMGKKVGDAVVVGGPDNFLIEWIKPKYLDALHHIMETFELYFPEADGFFRIGIGKGEPDQFKELFDLAKERREGIERLFGLYESSAVPLAMIGSVTGGDPVEVMIALVQTGRRFVVSDGAEANFEKARKALIENDGRGCVVDSITFHLMRRLSLEDVVEATCGRVGLVESTVLRLKEKRHQLSARLDEPDYSLEWRDGKPYRIEISSAQKKDAIEHTDRDLAWIAEHADVLPAKGLTDLSPRLREVTGRFGRGVVDEYMAAEAADHLLLSEDFAHRMLGEHECGLRTAWLQPVLMVALSAGKIDQARYGKAIVEMVGYNASFVSINEHVLLNALDGASKASLPNSYLIGLKALGGPNSDLRSHLTVAMNTLAGIWDSKVFPELAKKAATGALLEAITAHHWADFKTIVTVAGAWCRKNIRNGNEALTYIGEWARGHFVDHLDLGS